MVHHIDQKVSCIEDRRADKLDGCIEGLRAELSSTVTKNTLEAGLEENRRELAKQMMDSEARLGEDLGALQRRLLAELRTEMSETFRGAATRADLDSRFEETREELTKQVTQCEVRVNQEVSSLQQRLVQELRAETTAAFRSEAAAVAALDEQIWLTDQRLGQRIDELLHLHVRERERDVAIERRISAMRPPHMEAKPGSRCRSSDVEARHEEHFSTQAASVDVESRTRKMDVESRTRKSEVSKRTLHIGAGRTQIVGSGRVGSVSEQSESGMLETSVETREQQLTGVATGSLAMARLAGEALMDRSEGDASVSSRRSAHRASGTYAEEEREARRAQGALAMAKLAGEAFTETAQVSGEGSASCEEEHYGTRRSSQHERSRTSRPFTGTFLAALSDAPDTMVMDFDAASEEGTASNNSCQRAVRRAGSLTQESQRRHSQRVTAERMETTRHRRHTQEDLSGR